MIFYLGVHHEGWLDWLGIPLFVSRRRLHKRRRLPVAAEKWILDSGGFTELSLHGKWTISPRHYCMEARRYRDNIGKMEFACIQDWMCEPHMVYKTRLSVDQHIENTVNSWIELNAIAPDVKWMPVIQGFRLEQYMKCIELYDKRGVDLRLQKRVGIGSVCKRQHTTEIRKIVKAISDLGIPLHGFGMKTLGVKACKGLLASTDSMAWSFDALHAPPLPGCVHQNCANCPRYALHWYEQRMEELKA